MRNNFSEIGLIFMSYFKDKNSILPQKLEKNISYICSNSSSSKTFESIHLISIRCCSHSHLQVVGQVKINWKSFVRQTRFVPEKNLSINIRNGRHRLFQRKTIDIVSFNEQQQIETNESRKTFDKREREEIISLENRNNNEKIPR